MTEENKRSNIQDELRRAEDCLVAAQTMRDRGIASVAMSQAYYYGFHHARALLLSIGVEAKSHDGVFTMVALHFVKPGPLDPKMAHSLKVMEAGRLVADYDARSVLTVEMATQAIEQALAYAEAAQVILRADGYL